MECPDYFHCFIFHDFTLAFDRLISAGILTLSGTLQHSADLFNHRKNIMSTGAAISRLRQTTRK